MPRAKIKFSQIDPNPFRDLVGNPLRPERIEELVASMEHNAGFWENILVRPHPTEAKRFQLAHGHARMEAARRVGLTEAEFPVKDLSDHDMIVVMTQENVTQLGRDSYATYKEAVVAAATFIMAEVVTGPRVENFFHSDTPKRRISAVVNDILVGGCPGREVIQDFFRPKGADGRPDREKPSSLGLGDIRLALQTFHDTGALAAWHREHNPKAEKPEVAPVLNPEAIGKFVKTSHVQSFTEAVKREAVPFKEQPKIADQVIAKLTDNTKPKKSKKPKAAKAKPRESFDSSVPPNERMTSANISAEVSRQSYAINLPEKNREQAEAVARMTSCEKALSEIATGLTRASHGFSQLIPIATVLGSFGTEMSPLAMSKLVNIREALEEIHNFMNRTNDAIRIKQEAA